MTAAERRRLDPERWNRQYGGEPKDAAADVFHGSLNAALRAISSLPAPETGVWLDLGAGTGVLARSLAPPIRRVVDVDEDVAMCAFDRRRSDGRTWIVAAEAGHLPFATGSAAGASAVSLAGDLRDPGAALQDTARVLAPSAPLVATFTSRYGLFGLATFALRRMFAGASARQVRRYRAYSRARVRRAMRRVGLRPAAILSYNFFLGVGRSGRERRLPRRSIEGLARFPFVSTLLARNFVVTAIRSGGTDDTSPSP